MPAGAPLFAANTLLYGRLAEAACRAIKAASNRMTSDATAGDLVAEFPAARGLTTAFGTASGHGIPELPCCRCSRAVVFDDTLAKALAIKGLTMVDGDMTAVGEVPGYHSLNQKPAA